MSCGQIDFLEGGALQNVTVMGGQVSSALVQGCALDSCNLTHLRDIDTASAELIAKALMNLPAATLAALAKVLCKAYENNSDCGCNRIVPPPFSRCLVPPPPPPPAPAVVVPSGDDTTPDDGDSTDDTETGQGTVPIVPPAPGMPVPPPPRPVVIISGGDDDEEEEEGDDNG